MQQNKSADFIYCCLAVIVRYEGLIPFTGIKEEFQKCVAGMALRLTVSLVLGVLHICDGIYSDCKPQNALP